MSKDRIKILPENVANKIAAGEVVQRPESVVKELIENSIDAGAKNIELIIKRAGKTFIQVVDDGSGMSEEDAMLSVQRHATSKIFSIEDLDAINSYGFRGEALYAISAISQVEIKTKTEFDEIGTLIKIDDSTNIQNEKVSCSVGTSITVKNIFYNTPARRNFLKSDSTELKHIIETFKRESLSQPGIGFKFFNDDDLIFDFMPGTFEDRLKQVYADNILDVLVEVNEPTEFLSLYGYTAKPNFLKKNKGDQYLFINNRFVQSKQINHAVFKAYEHLLERGDYPFFVLFLKLDTKRIDINVHPSKLEVKFDDEKDIYSFVYSVIRKAIATSDLVPAAALSSNGEDDKMTLETSREKDFAENRKKYFDEVSSGRPRHDFKKSAFSDNEIDLIFGSLNPEIKNSAPQVVVDSPLERKIIPEENNNVVSKSPAANQEIPFIIQLHNKYILSQIRSGLMIIDQHVAHERILYEKAQRAFKANMPFSQQLLFSQTIKVDPGDIGLLKELQPYLTKLGFEIKFFGTDTVVIDGVPQDVKLGQEEEVLMDILHEYKKNETEKGIDEQDNLAKSFACKAAIKAGDALTEREMRLLVDQLFATSVPYVCPHGRPVIIKIPLDEFDKRFGRTS